MAEQSVTLQPGESKVVSFEATPTEARAYQVSVNGLSGSFKAVEAVPELVTFSVKLSDIPSYAAGSYQWYIDYGGKKHGMIDPQGGIWTPIDEAITVSGPQTGTLRATLMEGPWKSWTFTAGRKFQEGKEYAFNLTAGILASGVTLTNLVVEPDYFHVGKSTIISVTAVNTEETDEQYEVVFTIGAMEAAREIVNLGPKESKEVSIEVTPSHAGIYTVTVEVLIVRFEVIAPYPDITEPSIVSAEWIPQSGWTDIYHTPMIRGTIALPELGAKQWYVVSGVHGLMWEWPGMGTIKYAGNGIWDFTAGAPINRLKTHQSCPLTVTMWGLKCPACGGAGFTKKVTEEELRGKTPEQYLRNWLAGHGLHYCALGLQSHCAITGAEGSIVTTQETVYYASVYPCSGATTTMSVKVQLLEQYLQGIYTMTRLVKEWTLSTDLRLRMGINKVIWPL